MDVSLMAALGKAGAAMAIAMAAVGSALGAGTAGMTAAGAWKKCFAQKKSAPFLLLIFIGAPLSQTIYGMILMQATLKLCSLATYVPAETMSAAMAADPVNWMAKLDPAVLQSATEALRIAVSNWPAMISAMFLGGIAMGISAWYQGKAGAACADALAETGQGFGNYLMTIGIVETVALFVLVFIQAAIK